MREQTEYAKALAKQPNIYTQAELDAAIATAHQQGVEEERRRIVQNLFPDKKGDYKAWYDGDKLCVVNLNALTERETV